MSLSSQQYAYLANDSYELRKKDEEISFDGVKYKVLEHMDRRSGYQGTVYQRMDTREIIVAHRGTEFDRELSRDGVQADGGMLVARSNQQADDAIALTRRALDIANDIGRAKGRTPEVTVTGHSLGGCLAQITAHHFDLKGETFNPYGAASLDRRIPTGYDNVLNHVMAGDAVSASSPHFGQVKVYATPKEITTLTALGYDNNRNPLDSRAPLPAAFVAGYLGSHNMDNFINVDAEGRPDASVLRNPKAQQLAEQFDPMIDKFRSDIGVARGGITVISRDPVGRLKDGLDWIRGPLEPGEPAALEERAAAAKHLQESRGAALRFSPLYPQAPAEAPYVPEALKPNGVLSPLPDYLNLSSRTQIPMKPVGGSNAVSLNDDPSAFLDRMLAAAQSGDRDTFRQLTQSAADSEPGRALRAEAVAAVDRQEQIAVQQFAQQQLEQQATVARSGPRMA